VAWPGYLTVSVVVQCERRLIMSGPRRIVIGANGSPGSIRALRYAEDLAHFSGAALVPVIAWTPPGGELAERRAPSLELRRAWAEAARTRLRDAMNAAWGGLPGGLDVRGIVARGEPGLVLAGEASAEDLLVLGAGRRGLRSWLAGGRVARYCLRHAVCPVLAVPPAALGRPAGLRGWAFRHRELTVDHAIREWSQAA
jgi:nucleotide-binding universal stress UspA family protein